MGDLLSQPSSYTTMHAWGVGNKPGWAGRDSPLCSKNPKRNLRRKHSVSISWCENKAMRRFSSFHHLLPHHQDRFPIAFVPSVRPSARLFPRVELSVRQDIRIGEAARATFLRSEAAAAAAAAAGHIGGGSWSTFSTLWIHPRSRKREAGRTDAFSHSQFHCPAGKGARRGVRRELPYYKRK